MPKPGASLIHAAFHAPQGAWHINPHCHSDYEMVVVTRGHEDVEVEGRRFRANVGDVLLFRPGVVHEEWSDAGDPLRTYFATFTWPLEGSRWPLRSVDEQGRIRLLLAWLYELRDADTPATKAAAGAYFLALIREFMRVQGCQDDPMVVAVRTFIRQHIQAPLTVDALARQVGRSKFHFIRRYRQLTGRSPMEDARMIRLGHARDLMLTTDLPVKAIAPLAGLGDEVALYRLFRRYLSTTPGQLRRAFRR